MTITKIKSTGTNFWDWVDNRTVFRRSIIIFLLWATYDITLKLIAYAYSIHDDRTGASLMVAAVTVPWGYVIKEALVQYTEARKEKDATNPS